MEILLLAVAAWFTSAFAAAIGQGGGLMLMPVLAGSIPAASLIPVHGIIQIASNGSRAFTNRTKIKWSLLPWIAIGCLIGGVVLLPFLATVNWGWMQTTMGVFILLLTWGPSPGKALQKLGRSNWVLMVIGGLQGSLGMLIGATGPLGSAVLLKHGLNAHQLVATNAAIMLMSHMTKVILFGLLGAVIWQHWWLILGLSIAAVLGTLAGNRLRNKLSAPIFFILFKAVLTALAIRMILLPWIVL